jgi:hypothetical protein
MPIEIKIAARTAVITDAVKMPVGSPQKLTNPPQPRIAPSGWKLLDEDVRVDRHPVPVDEPPAADGEDESDAAADDAADPDVVAAGTRHDCDQRRVHDRLEAEIRTREDDREEQASLRDERTGSEDVEAERDQKQLLAPKAISELAEEQRADAGAGDIDESERSS